MKNILVTGGRGFIGFNALQLWKKKHPEYNYVCVDAHTYADEFLEVEKNEFLDENNIPRYEFNLASNDVIENHLEPIFNLHNIDTIVHFGAESHVDNSIKNPNIFFASNIIGTMNLLNFARKHDLRIHIVSTDEVYGETSPESWKYDFETLYGHEQRILDAEEMPLVPSSPYSSSKASADMIALSYHRTFGTKVTISRCTNNFGPWQMTEKLIPTVISKALKNEQIPVYGEGNQKRHWVHVDEHNEAIIDIIEKGEIGKTYNIAPPKENWITNIELIKFILKHLEKPESLISHVTDRLGHDTTYFLYGTDFCQRNGLWQDDMRNTIMWYEKQLKK